MGSKLSPGIHWQKPSETVISVGFWSSIGLLCFRGFEEHPKFLEASGLSVAPHSFTRQMKKDVLLTQSVLLIIVVLVASGVRLHHDRGPASAKASEDIHGASGVILKEDVDKIEVSIGSQPFTVYRYKGYNKPVFFPLRAASGTIVTRNYPMTPDIPGEDTDHPHHKGLWLTHGDVNGIDFWSENPQGGKIVHRKLEQVRSGDRVGILRSRNDWIAPGGRRLLEEIREVKIYALTDARAMDFDFQLRAVDSPVKFGDTKEGTFGIRLVHFFSEKSGGLIQNSRGSVGEKNCWGRRAEWVDYSATVNGEELGLAIFDHPKSFRHPTYWHVRGYTLFAVNPFGLHDFYNDKTKDGSYTIQKGETLTLRYRVFIHAGTAQQSRIAEQYKNYAEGNPPSPE